jgi:RNA polymerase sigma-70 factor (ECF subfamily)
MNGTEQTLPLPLIRAKRAPAPTHTDCVTTSTDPTDEQLLERIREGDESSALMLFRRYDKVTFSIGFRIIQDEGEAEDLVQELFMRLSREAQSFDKEKGSARTWVIQMIYRRAFDRRSYLNRRQFYSGTDAAEYTNTLVERKNSEEEIIDRLTVQQLKAGFSELSDRQRETLEMFFFEGLKLPEIAERTGEDVKNVRHHYYRGLERLRQITRQMLQPGGFSR